MVSKTRWKICLLCILLVWGLVFHPIQGGDGYSLDFRDSGSRQQFTELYKIQSGEDNDWVTRNGNENQQYSPDTLEWIDDGLLIRARIEGDQIYSGRFESYASTAYGAWTIRAKLPIGIGTWPAIWLLGDTGEIDIMEYLGSKPAVIWTNIHTPEFDRKHDFPELETYELSDATTTFHDYGVTIAPESITFLLDGVVLRTVPRSASWQFGTPMRLVINMAIGGDWTREINRDYPDGIDRSSVNDWQFAIQSISYQAGDGA